MHCTDSALPASNTACVVFSQPEVTPGIVACIFALHRTFLEKPQSWSDNCNKLYNGNNNVYNSTGQLTPAAFHPSCEPSCWLNSRPELHGHLSIIYQ
jgi:hypothetical protein